MRISKFQSNSKDKKHNGFKNWLNLKKLFILKENQLLPRIQDSNRNYDPHELSLQFIRSLKVGGCSEGGIYSSRFKLSGILNFGIIFSSIFLSWSFKMFKLTLFKSFACICICVLLLWASLGFLIFARLSSAWFVWIDLDCNSIG
jgi:hypothetical protein